jgi:hypothetical protein
MIRKTRIILLGTGILPFALAGCATADGDYPSLAIRDAERSANEVVPAPQLDPAPPPPVASAALLERVETLRQQAGTAHDRFLSAVPAARRTVSAGAGASRASDAWAGAQVALADLESLRSVTAVPLADLDELLTSQATAFEPAAEVAAARADVIRMVAEEDEILAGLRSRLR